MEIKEEKMNFLKKHPYVSSVLLAFGIGMAVGIWQLADLLVKFGSKDLAGNVFMSFVLGAAVGIFVVYPFLLTLINVIFFFRPGRCEKGFEGITIILGSLYSGLVLIFYEIQFQSDWDEVLYNSQKHTPIFTQTYPTILTLAVVGVLGYLILSFVPLEKMPPLVIVCSMAAMYLGIAECVVWMIQLFPDIFLSLFPANCVLIAVKTIVHKIQEWNGTFHEEKQYQNKFLNHCNRILRRSSYWPVAAFILMWPLLGIIIGILALFGQQPDAVIKAWTQTSDWNLSKRVAPQNLYYDEHYLCTVAAGGHKKVVKPLRLGVRHGHEVIVNRQLCVANAFEQILEERVPRFHKIVRHLYDTYGFPIAKLVHSPYVADCIYILMKPLEWLFLMVLYFCDVNPENRIAVQYLPKCNTEK